MKAIFNFNVQIDGYKSVVTMDSENVKGLDIDTLVVLGKLFKDVQNKVSNALEKQYNEDRASKQDSVTMENEEIPASAESHIGEELENTPCAEDV